MKSEYCAVFYGSHKVQVINMAIWQAGNGTFMVFVPYNSHKENISIINTVKHICGMFTKIPDTRYKIFYLSLHVYNYTHLGLFTHIHIHINT